MSSVIPSAVALTAMLPDCTFAEAFAGPLPVTPTPPELAAPSAGTNGACEKRERHGCTHPVSHLLVLRVAYGVS